MTNPLIGIAATVVALFVVIQLVTTYVVPYLDTVNTGLAGVLAR